MHCLGVHPDLISFLFHVSFYRAYVTVDVDVNKSETRETTHLMLDFLIPIIYIFLKHAFFHNLLPMSFSLC